MNESTMEEADRIIKGIKKISVQEEELPKNVLCKIKDRVTINPTPFIKIEDLNNQNNQDILDCNPSRPSVRIGLKWTF